MSETQERPESYESNIAQEVQLGLGDGHASTGASQPPRKRARKSHNACTGRPDIRTVGKRKGKGRKTAGSLSELVNMPLDVFFEIAAHLHPLDMLHLARTSKSFRSVLLAKSTRAAWIVSLSAMDALPSCPENMCEPFYAALLFDRYCFLCGADNGKWVDYAIRLRLCKACCKTNIQKGSAIVGKAEKDLFRTLPLFPCETRSDKYYAEKFVSPENRTAANKYYTAQVNATIAKYNRLKQQNHEAEKRMMEETLKDVAATHIHATKIYDWFEKERFAKLSTNEQIMSDRKFRITERLQVLGYTEDDFPTYNDVWDKLVDQPKPLTDRIWNNIRAKLEEQLAVEKERRVQGAFQARVDNRLAVIMEWYDDYLEEHLTDAERSLMPNHYDARLLPSLLSLAQANDAQGSVQRKAFLALTKRMLADAEVYKARAKRALADVVCDMPEWNPQTCVELKGLPADEVLQRYCAYFTCRAGCHGSLYTRPYLTYDEVHVHWRESHPERPWFPSDEYECEVGPLSMVASLALFPQALAARHALEAVGIPLETPQSVLDQWTREGRLFCACEHPEMPLPAEMSWSMLLRHLLAHTNMRRMLESSITQFRGRHDPDLVLCDNHSLIAGTDCCIKFLPEGENSIAAFARTTIDDALRAQIDAKLAAPPEPGEVAVCRICKGLTSETLLQAKKNIYSTVLPEWAEDIVWHLRSCHGKVFEMGDIVFVPPY